ncbi:MAG: lysophospholipid acyltransferase family protein [Pikeienuella sp.]
MTDSTWNAAAPPVLPPLTLIERVRGGLRLSLLLALTGVVLGVFLVGHNLRRGLGRGGLGRWVVFHFGAARLWSRLCLRLLGLRREMSGRPVDRGALVANHSSWIDILALRACHLIYFVSKAEVADWPGVGFITKVTGTVFIERKRGEAKRQEAVLLERIAADQVLCFFPEGTSTDGRRVLPFKSTLFSAFLSDGAGAEIAIQPVSLCYRPAPHLPPEFYGWWGNMGFGAHIWQVCCRSRRGRVEIVFHPPVNPSDFRDRKALAVACQSVVAERHATATQRAV